jgi:hypothetical protein
MRLASRTMTNRPRLLTGATAVVLAAVSLAAGCTTPPQQRPSPQGVSVQPSLATYRCGEGGDLRVENGGSSVRVTFGEDDPVELAAAPPGQRSRYGADGYALVLEDREALWMKAGKVPLTCRR